MSRLRDYEWEVSYKTSSVRKDGKPVDILHDFYIPALQRSVRYDRMAGYFRSTSLAAASQGFSTFIGREGKMRLVVGSDMDPTDVATILGAVDMAKAGAFLSARLNGIETWSTDVRNGVELLARMVASGTLDIRVAFRVHINTGEPVPADSTEDGYVHEKWMLLFDEAGDAIYAAGSLNESRTALARNAENLSIDCNWWEGMHRIKIEKAATDFERIWDDKSPALRVLTLPEAVQKRLIKIAESSGPPVEIDGTSAAPKTIAPPSACERLLFAFIRDAPKMPGGCHVGMYTAPVEAWPHQEVVARRLIDTWPYCFMLCDEVGLGKTIEAGLAIRALHLSGTARRILISAPASLCPQWHREMASKFLLPFALATSGRYEYLHPCTREEHSKTLFDPDLMIVSNALLSREERTKELKHSTPYDVALLDEAHYARRQNPTSGPRSHPRYGRLYQAVDTVLRKRAGALWLATATPMQLDPIEVADLVRLTSRAGAFLEDPSLLEKYYLILGKLVRDAEPTAEEWTFLRESIRSIQRTDPFLDQYLREAVIDALTKNAVEMWINRGQIPKGIHRKRVLRFIFAAAPLSRVMLRHTRSLLEEYRTRGQLGANLAKRHILQVPRITFTEQEQQSYEQLEEYCRALINQIEKNRPQDKAARAAVGFYLSFLRLRFASSLFAIHHTLKRRRQKVIATLQKVAEETPSDPVDWESLLTEDDDLGELAAVESVLKNRTKADLEWEIGQLDRMITTLEILDAPSSKMAELFKAINQRRANGRVQQMVIFSRFYDTVVDIVRRLREQDPDLYLGIYSGQGAGGQYYDPTTRRMVGVDREVVKHRFVQGGIDILICTDAAAEGLNLQSADLLINFDLPWNPMKVEQRIGRIDRIGQKHEHIFVLNLCYADSVEQLVYDRLLNRLAEAGSVVGQQQVSMLPVTLEEFRDLAEGTLSADELEGRAKVRLAERQHREATKQIPSEELYGIYQRYSQSWKKELRPVDLPGIEKTLLDSKHLKDLGTVATGEGKDVVLTVSGVPTVVEGAKLTVSRRIYEAGLKDGGSVHFASYGDEVFEGILDHFQTFELPPCIRRVEESSDGITMVAYVAAVKRADGSYPVCLSSLVEAATVTLDEQCVLTDDALLPTRETLRAKVAEEKKRRRAIESAIKRNLRAAEAQRHLALMVIADILRVRANGAKAKDSTFTSFAANDIEPLILQRSAMSVGLRPLEVLRNIHDDILFPVTAPQLGTSGNMTTPRFLSQCALDAAHRLCDAMRSGQGQRTVEAVLNRIESELRQ